jgi:hypothetical protein
MDEFSDTATLADNMGQEDEVQAIENAISDRESVTTSEFKVYKRRWAMLALYTSYTVISAFQWIQYAIIAKVIVHYYNVPFIAVNWTSTIFMLAFVVTIIPATWFYNKVVRLFFKSRSFLYKSIDNLSRFSISGFAPCTFTCDGRHMYWKLAESFFRGP